MSSTLGVLEYTRNEMLEGNVEVGLLRERNVVGDQVDSRRRTDRGNIYVGEILVVGVGIHRSKAVKVLDAVHESPTMNIIEVLVEKILVQGNELDYPSSALLVVDGVQRVIKVEELSKVVAKKLDRHSKGHVMMSSWGGPGVTRGGVAPYLYANWSDS